MALSPGDRLGVYEVTAEIGAGGMGIVYRARDTKLGRDVALKVLPDLFADDPERLARFQREARVLASLNHPNIASIYGLEEADGVRALVLELVEGPTLAERIAQGALPVDEALPIARQIADALEAAHEAGVIHRDLKPANVKVKADGMVKVLDFGLAKALEGDAGSDPSESPTMTAAATRAGVIMGTAAYMSPEQAKGKVVDKRADIWAFGAVVYEMLTGLRAFAGATVLDTLAAVLRADVNWDVLPPSTPARLRQVLGACLQKNPKQRVHDIADVRLAMEGVFEPPASPSGEAGVASPLQPWQRPIPAVIAALALVTLTGIAVWSLTSRDAGPRFVSRFAIPLASTTMHGMAVSPSGDRVVYAAPRNGQLQLFVRARDEIEAVPLRGTEGASHPFFSPDGEWIGFSTDDELKKIAVEGRTPVTLCQLDAHRGATWGPDDTIVFAPRNTPNLRGLMQVSAAGGEPRPLTSPPPEEGRHAWPHFGPDGGLLFFTTGPDAPLTSKRVAVLSVETGEQKTLTAGTGPAYVATGHLVFGREASLWAAGFDRERLELTGEPAPIVESVFVSTGNGAANYALANDGTLAYRVALGTSGDPATGLVWVDRQGGEHPVDVPARAYRSPRISPDGTRVAVSIGDPSPDNSDIWVVDLSRGTLSRVTTDSENNRSPAWTPDGQRLVFESDREGTLGLFLKNADGQGNAERLFTMDNTNVLVPTAWTADGDLVFTYRTVEGGYNYDVGLVSLDGERSWRPLLRAESAERAAVLSPAATWIAYSSNETGQREVYVQQFPELGRRQRISVDGGGNPVWSPDGNEIVYQGSEGRLMAVSVHPGSDMTFGNPSVLFEGTYYQADGRHYDRDPDGGRFLMIAAPPQTDAPPINVVLNWSEELKQRLPVP